MKKAAKAFVVSILARQVKQLRKKHEFKVIAVVGSIGKTSTKFAIAQVLSETKRVRYQEGNYNDIVSVPLIFFGHSMPSLLSPFAWFKIFRDNAKQIKGNYPYDVVVVELGTDRVGQIGAFQRYIAADVGVVTAIAQEHMEYFGDMNTVATEELAVALYSSQLLINTDLCAEEYLVDLKESHTSYGMKTDATYHMDTIAYNQSGSTFVINKDKQQLLQAAYSGFSEPQLYSLMAATAVADLLDIPPEAITAGLKRIKPVSGRMQRLNGIKGSTIIDDSYNASPDAVKTALQTLYRLDATQKIAVLGNMNELGALSESAHTDAGTYCDPKQLDLVVTLGPDANTYLAAAAEKNGCTVLRTESPYEAGEKVAEHLKEGGLVLVKGSQNRVYAEEAIKSLLADSADQAKLVRQSASWLAIKSKQFAQPLKEVN